MLRIECSTLRIAKKFSEVGIWLYRTKNTIACSIIIKATTILRRAAPCSAKASFAKMQMIPRATTPRTARATPWLCSSQVAIVARITTPTIVASNLPI
ncbi:hypothetical protein D3C86_1845280 [compost metagenome]